MVGIPGEDDFSSLQVVSGLRHCWFSCSLSLQGGFTFHLPFRESVRIWYLSCACGWLIRFSVLVVYFFLIYIANGDGQLLRFDEMCYIREFHSTGRLVFSFVSYSLGIKRFCPVAC